VPAQKFVKFSSWYLKVPLGSGGSNVIGRVA
jgi:hypothetical protein